MLLFGACVRVSGHNSWNDDEIKTWVFDSHCLLLWPNQVNFAWFTSILGNSVYSIKFHLIILIKFRHEWPNHDLSTQFNQMKTTTETLSFYSNDVVIATTRWIWMVFICGPFRVSFKIHAILFVCLFFPLILFGMHSVALNFCEFSVPNCFTHLCSLRTEPINRITRQMKVEFELAFEVTRNKRFRFIRSQFIFIWFEFKEMNCPDACACANCHRITRKIASMTS